MLVLQKVSVCLSLKFLLSLPQKLFFILSVKQAWSRRTLTCCEEHQNPGDETLRKSLWQKCQAPGDEMITKSL